MSEFTKITRFSPNGEEPIGSEPVTDEKKDGLLDSELDVVSEAAAGIKGEGDIAEAIFRLVDEKALHVGANLRDHCDEAFVIGTHLLSPSRAWPSPRPPREGMSARVPLQWPPGQAA